ncbi:MAG: transcription elongation factor GreA [Chloroflexi bacterium]|nr:transcription elongation factor GreA [Chloroflexota bacterium]
MDSQAGPNKTFLTAEGARKLQEELDLLRNVKRPELAERLRFAIKQGDLSENADYAAAKEEQSFLEGRILELERVLRDIVILDETASKQGVARLGSRVTVVEQGFPDRETFQLVGRAEADPAQGKISNESPLGQKLIGKRVGDAVRVAAPGGETIFKVVAVE